MSGPAEKFVVRLARGGSEGERDWARAALAEADALPPQRRRSWLRGAAWFLLRHRRPAPAQLVCALAGAGYGLLLVLLPVADLRDDAPDAPFASDVAVLVAGSMLVATFVLAAMRPLLGAFAATLTLPLSVLLTLVGRQAAFSPPLAEPPAGYAPIAASAGALEPFVALFVLVGLPTLALAGAVLPLSRRQGGVRASAS